MKSFKEYVNEKDDDLGELQKAWNKYRFELDRGTEQKALEWKKKVDIISKRVLKQDIDARTSSGMLWKKVLNEEYVSIEESSPKKI